MIISHRYRYLFVEIPHTASTAISRELCEHYDGTPILYKHATYPEYLKDGRYESGSYFTFASIRNPLDMVVTAYFKQKTNHQRIYTNPQFWKKHGGHVSALTLHKFDYLKKGDNDFVTYFKEFYKIPYDSRGSPAPQDFDFVIRFESLQKEFAKVLESLGALQVRPLPIVNRTAGREEDFNTYYTPDTYARSKRVFGPYMKRWGYDFPLEWKSDYSPWLSEMQFYILSIFRRHFMWRSSSLIRMLSVLRVKLHV